MPFSSSAARGFRRHLNFQNMIIKQDARVTSSHSEIAPPPSAIADLSTPGPFEGADFSLSCGDLAPDWTLESAPGRRFSFFDDYASGYTRLLLVGAATGQDDELIRSFVNESMRHAANGVRVCLILSPEATSIPSLPEWVVSLIDSEEEVAASLRCPAEGAAAVLLRGNQHIAAMTRCSAASPFPAELHEACVRLQSERTLDSPLSRAPILTVPDVFSVDECRTLIEIFNTRGQVVVQADKATNYFDADYKMHVPDQMRGDRIDHFFFEKSTVRFLLRRLIRVEQEVARAFHYRITQHETLRVARYQGTRGGYGYGHRDNVPPTEYRRFALSINLNTEEFTGGAIRFPEFGDALYRPPTGSAFVFSSSLLHEVLEVTGGTRYVLLSFMF